MRKLEICVNGSKKEGIKEGAENIRKRKTIRTKNINGRKRITHLGDEVKREI